MGTMILDSVSLHADHLYVHIWRRLLLVLGVLVQVASKFLCRSTSHVSASWGVACSHQCVLFLSVTLGLHA